MNEFAMAVGGAYIALLVIAFLLSCVFLYLGTAIVKIQQFPP